MKMMKVLLMIVLVLGAVSAAKKKNKKNKQTAAILEQLKALEERLSASEQNLSEAKAEVDERLSVSEQNLSEAKAEVDERLSASEENLSEAKAQVGERLSASEEKLSEAEAQLEDGKGQLAGALETIHSMKGEQIEISESNAWQSLHGAAAAACRGSTESGGTGPWGNAVIPKDNTRSCDDICGASTHFTICDADVSLSGFPGKAADYTTPIGYFYNYGCGTPGNQDVRFDEVKSESGAILTGSGARGAYYRFCCCRKP